MGSGNEDLMKEVNEQIRSFHEGTLNVTPNVFEGIVIPSTFQETLQGLTFPIPDDVPEEDVPGEEEEEELVELPPQVPLKVLKRVKDEGEGSRQSPKDKGKTRKNPFVIKDYKVGEKGKWATTAEEEEREKEEIVDEETPAEYEEGEVPEDLEEPEAEGGREEGEPNAEFDKRGQIAYTGTIMDLDDLLDELKLLGISLDKREISVLKRKSDSMGGLTVRDGIMFMEGLRTAHTISESKMTEHIEVLEKSIAKQKAQVVKLERAVSEMKRAEQGYLGLMEQISTEKKSVQAVVDKQIQGMIAEEKKKLISYREAEERAIKDKLIAERDLWIEKMKKGTSASSSPTLTPKKKETRTPEKAAPRKEKKEARSFLTPSETLASAELLSLVTYMKTGVRELADHYELTIEQMNDELGGFPRTMSGWAKEYGSASAAADAIHSRFYHRSASGV
ncbi:TPA_asm: protein 2 [Pinus flexilis virus 1]|uniref:Protein 2 n=1 Tax=Pinus flexilis virus 1 TaxID=2793737 RepID=A0A8D9PGY9_9RHAB|nr:protein 2 [Pinus flexilis virus 1]DAF42370.1 TPA_asm: protein 2 [Pinus flexilis virus 1]